MARKRRVRGEGSIYQRGDGLWVGSVSLGTGPDGKPRKKVVYGKTAREAGEKLRELRTNLGKLNAPLRAAKKQTLADYLAGWLALRTCGEGCKVNYQKHIDLWIRPIVGHVPMAKLEGATISYLYEEMQNRGCSGDYVRRVGGMLRSALKGCGLPKNPAAAVPLPRKDHREIHPLSQDEIKALLRHAKQTSWYDLYVLAIDSGMRLSELFALQWSDFDWNTNSVMVQRAMEGTGARYRPKPPKSKAGKRRIQLAPETIGLLQLRYRSALANGKVSLPVFHSKKGTWLRQPNFYHQSWSKVRAKAGLTGHRFHDLRHTCATQLLLAGENVKVISARLGHSSIEMTLSTYAHVLDAMQEQATVRMSGLLGKVMPRHDEEE